ncbi:GDP-mannose 4,6-dehydratase [Metallumcola ferriviriculae]|uniref:GDP-mannose 4,6-dehydratase n=1 Tax=Metallumcola ferriviriculae TaxID=3039180 RepID=A0AAU0UM83_9FIRM|nr:GDP-mannose 4,6-dehydratase [Desulfitibacteraceae bacterium MK1]
MLKKTQKVLVTGGAGFIGSHLIDNLIEEGHIVISVDDFNEYYDPDIKWRNISAHCGNPKFNLIRCDICDRSRITQVFLDNQPDIIVHLAARAGVRPSLTNPSLYTEVNVNGTLNILEAAARIKVKKFIFGSSSSVYGVNKKVPYSENDALLTPISPYAATKIAGEALCHSFAHLHHINMIALRFFTVYGPRQRPDLAIHKFANLIMASQRVPVYGDGSSQRDYTYIGDIVKGIRLAMDYQLPQYYEVFNIGNSQPVKLLDLISWLEEVIGIKVEVDYQPTQPGDVPITWADTQKAERLLMYRPITPLKEGLVSFVNWLGK